MINLNSQFGSFSIKHFQKIHQISNSIFSSLPFKTKLS